MRIPWPWLRNAIIIQNGGGAQESAFLSSPGKSDVGDSQIAPWKPAVWRVLFRRGECQ